MIKIQPNHSQLSCLRAKILSKGTNDSNVSTNENVVKVTADQSKAWRASLRPFFQGGAWCWSQLSASVPMSVKHLNNKWWELGWYVSCIMWDWVMQAGREVYCNIVFTWYRYPAMHTGASFIFVTKQLYNFEGSIKCKKSSINYHYGHFYWNSYRVLLFIWLLSTNWLTRQ